MFQMYLYRGYDVHVFTMLLVKHARST